jgi:hypothetical protein
MYHLQNLKAIDLIVLCKMACFRFIFYYFFAFQWSNLLHEWKDVLND